jgi:hypothetical protein
MEQSKKMNLELKLKDKWDFERKPRFGNGIQYIFEFGNGYSASVVKNEYSHGSESDLWELGVFKNGHLHYDNPVANGDVCGHLTDEEVEKLLTEIKSFKKEIENDK